ncbi:hypothetical protein [Streptomyces sp. TLI_185]|uniref:hypothetical protein n=1 Tax=Streptomyces sp. TLI_185 TaxID=2485151 RepID=UPI000F4DFDED|nr:hypothetical protein [Streptomyces sp. TLI_185]RPF33591.1 hypothetical protein EDD92_3512 [Streptomyces sp. TLI_185]
MGKPNTRRLDKEIQRTQRKIEAVQNEEMWPLTGQERRQVARAVIGGSYRVTRGKSTGRAERALENVWNAVQIRLTTELTALESERQRIVTEAANAKAAKKSSGWF